MYVCAGVSQLITCIQLWRGVGWGATRGLHQARARVFEGSFAAGAEIKNQAFQRQHTWEMSLYHSSPLLHKGSSPLWFKATQRVTRFTGMCVSPHFMSRLGSSLYVSSWRKDRRCSSISHGTGGTPKKNHHSYNENHFEKFKPIQLLFFQDQAFTLFIWESHWLQ